MKATGKTIVVTGGGNGIGQQVVLELLKRGARVAAVDISEEGLESTRSLAGSVGERLSLHTVNVTDRDAIDALPDVVIEAHGEVDGLINVAGVVQDFVGVADLERSVMERVMNINFWGVVNTTTAFIPHLKKRPEAALVNISSMGALTPVPGQAVYSASKAAVKLFTESLYGELRSTPVTVTVVFPGAIETEITKNSGAKLPEWTAEGASEASAFPTTSAVDAATEIIHAMEQGKFRATVGRDAMIMDYFSRAVPRRATEFIAKRMASLLS